MLHHKQWSIRWVVLSFLAIVLMAGSSSAGTPARAASTSGDRENVVAKDEEPVSDDAVSDGQSQQREGERIFLPLIQGGNRQNTVGVSDGTDTAEDLVTVSNVTADSWVVSFAMDASGEVIETFPVEQNGTVQLLLQDPKEGSATAPIAVPVIHPDLAAIAAQRPNDLVQAIILFAEDTNIERFPALPIGVRRDSDQGRPIIEERQQRINELRERRALHQAPLVERMRKSGATVQVRRHFGLINALSATIRAGDAAKIARMTEVIGVKLNQSKIRPSADNNTSNDPVNARGPSHLNSDLFFDSPNIPSSPQAGYIAMIDTGIADHILLDPIEVWGLDCINGDIDCLDAFDGSTPNFDADDCYEHGTPVAAIMVGTDALGDAHRGLTAYHLDSYKVFSGCTDEDIETTDELIIQALEAAIGWGGAHVINMSIGATANPETDPVALAADAAFDAGAIVVAANGNDGNQVDCPACAHKVLGVGAYDLNGSFLDLVSYSDFGPTNDGRIKPDLTAPTNVETAAIQSFNAVDVFNGTSAASPFVAASAMLVRQALITNVPDWMATNLEEPGYTYAAMILFGRYGQDSINHNEGVGGLHLAQCGRFWFGKTTVAGGETSSHWLNLTPPYGSGGITAAIWWPEDANQAPNDIDLYLDSPSGEEMVNSIMYDSVFERLATGYGLAESGAYRLHITGVVGNPSPQEVYWAAHAGGCDTNLAPPNP